MNRNDLSVIIISILSFIYLLCLGNSSIKIKDHGRVSTLYSKGDASNTITKKSIYICRTDQIIKKSCKSIGRFRKSLEVGWQPWFVLDCFHGKPFLSVLAEILWGSQGSSKASWSPLNLTLLMFCFQETWFCSFLKTCAKYCIP